MNPEVLVSELETLSTKRRLSQGDKDRFVTLVEQLDKVDDWESSYPNLATFVSKTLDKMEDKEVIKRRIITKLRKESAFLGIFRSEDRVTILDETRVIKGASAPRRAPRTGVDTSKLSAEEKVLLALPQNIRDNQKLIVALSSMGIVVENGVARFGTSFEQQNKKEKLIQFLNFFNYLYENPTPEGIVENYFCLLTGKGAVKSFEFIDDATRKYLRQMYIEAAFKRMNAKGMTIVKSTDNTRYEVFYTEAGKRDKTANGNVFERLVKGNSADKTQANSEDLDFGILYNIYSRDTRFNSEAASEKSIIEGILAKHKILARKEGTAYTGGVIDATTLEDNKDIVLEQINAKLTVLSAASSGAKAPAKGTEVPNSTQFADNIQSYQELSFLRSWLVGKEYVDHTQINNTTKLVNEFWIYQKVTALVGTRLSTPASATTTGGQMREIAGMALPFAIPLALFGWLTGHSKEAFYGLAGLLGLYVGGNIVDSSGAGALLKRGTDALGVTASGNIDMKKSSDIISEPLVSKDFSAASAKIQKANIENRKKVDSGNTAPYLKNNFIIGKIIFEIERANTDWNLDEATTAGAIWRKIQTYAEINGSEFVNIPKPFLGQKITENDIKSFLALLKQNKQDGDTTVLDALNDSGKDNMSVPYEKFYEKDMSITGSKEFDTTLNATFKSYFDNARTPKGKRDIADLRAKLKSGVSKDFITWIVGGNIPVPSTTGITNWSQSNDAELLRIQNIITEFSARRVSSNVLDIIKNYKIFVDANYQFNTYNGTFGKVNGAGFDIFTQDGLQMVSKWTNLVSFNTYKDYTDEEKIQFLDAMKNRVTADKTALNGIAFDRANTIFAGLEEKRLLTEKGFDNLIAKIEAKKKSITDGLTGILGTITGAAAIDDKENLRKELLSNPTAVARKLQDADISLKSILDEINKPGVDLPTLIGKYKGDLKTLTDLKTAYSGFPSALTGNPKTVADTLDLMLGNSGIVKNIRLKLIDKVNSYLSGNKIIINDFSTLSIAGTTPGTIDEVKLRTAIQKLGTVGKFIDDRGRSNFVSFKTPILNISGLDLSLISGWSFSLGTSNVPTDTEFMRNAIDALGLGVATPPTPGIVDQDKTIDLVITKYKEKLTEVKTGMDTFVRSADKIEQIPTLKIIKELSGKGVVIDGVDAKISTIRTKTLTEKKVSDFSDLGTLIAGFKTAIDSSSLTEEQRLTMKARIVPTMTLEALKIQTDLLAYAPIVRWFKDKNLTD